MMKKLFILISVLIMALGTKAETTVLPTFKEVRVNVPSYIRFVQGDNYSMDIQATDSLVASAIRWTVEDDVLKINSIDENEELFEVYITIVSPHEPKLAVGRNMEIKLTHRILEKDAKE